MRLGVYANAFAAHGTDEEALPANAASTKSAPTSLPPPTWIGRNTGARRVRISLAAAVALVRNTSPHLPRGAHKTPDEKTHDGIPPHRHKKTQPGSCVFNKRRLATQTDTAVRAAQGGGKGIGIKAVFVSDDNIAVIDVHH